VRRAACYNIRGGDSSTGGSVDGLVSSSSGAIPVVIGGDGGGSSASR